MQIKTKSPKGTQRVAEKLAGKILKSKPQRHATVIALEGELGAGKTTFVKGFAKALGIKSHIASPTFVILKKYSIPKPIIRALNKLSARPSTNKVGALAHNLKPKTCLFHIDAYRLRDHRELAPLGIKNVFDDPENIVLLEWAERVRKILPRKYIRVHIDHTDENSRRIITSQIF